MRTNDLRLQNLPTELYSAAEVKNLDRCIIEKHGISDATLMERAGSAAWMAAQRHWPNLHDVTVICGTGNNGGDGYVVARLALDAGCTVRVLQLGDLSKLTNVTRIMVERYQAADGFIEFWPISSLAADASVVEKQKSALLDRPTDLIVDAIFGIGLTREVSGVWAQAIMTINEVCVPILALDIPSGLNADTGCIMGCAIRAQLTVTFIALKQGLLTGDGPECCGYVQFASLGAPKAVYDNQIAKVKRIDWQQCAEKLHPRPRNAHKGNFGHVLVIGGNSGMNGALRLAGEAAARCGAGMVTLATACGQGAMLNITCPELMCHEVATPEELEPLLDRATVVAIGPGLGQSAWSQDLFTYVLQVKKKLVVDADALNLLAASSVAYQRSDWVLTPHPKEAARLLKCSTVEVQQDRFAALHNLMERYHGTVILKGSGTLVGNKSSNSSAICTAGNPGMATAGIGDVLTGIIASLIAQGWIPEDSVDLGVCLHATAGDLAAKGGERGLLASDILPYLRGLLNHKIHPTHIY
ncbi:hypothetical protein TI03_02890 [Achromatium sp. WMS1]|nr:hypothetical protein TI03_02890 [Achromatium sp. WMS1]